MPASGNSEWWRPEGTSDDEWLAWARLLPFCRDLGLECTHFSETLAVFRMEKVVLTANPNGSVNGGVVAAAADQVMGAMAMRVSGPELLPATGSFHIQYHSPARAPLTFRAVSLGGGRRTKFIEVTVEDCDGNRCATSHGTMVMGGSSPSRG